MNVNGLARNGRADPRTVGLEESLGRVATLAAAALSAPSASVMSADARALPEISGVPGIDDHRSPFEQLLYAEVVGSRDKVIIGDTRLGRSRGNGDLFGPASVIAWAGVPVRDQDGHVAGVLWVADRKPRRWSTSDVAILEILAEVASSDVTLRAALAHSAGRAALAQTLEESLLPPPLPGIPGLQVAARYAVAGTGAEVLADFCDVFPSAGRTWGLVVGDVYGKGSAAAKATALARHTLRTAARRQTRPSLILAHLNQMLLDWPTDDPPELHDVQRLLRPGDNLVMFSDGVTEARAGRTGDLYGDERLRSLVARLGDLTAAAMADAIRSAMMTFSGGPLSDDIVALVMKVPA